MVLTKKLLALDVGAARIGIAVCLNPLGVVSPRPVVVRSKSVKEDARRLEELISSNGIGTVVIGLPEDADPAQADKTRLFAQRLMRRSGMPPFVFWNEAFSSREAEEEMIEMGKSRKKRRALIDSSAAALILESYIRCEGK